VESFNNKVFKKGLTLRLNAVKARDFHLKIQHPFLD
ncbi:uncharacterized protein METZ01_LOCUS112504, partial [marine metagenome]